MNQSHATDQTPRVRLNAFSLVELIIVVMILGILASVAVPRFIAASVDAKASAVLASVRDIFNAAELLVARDGQWPPNTEEYEFPEEFEGYLPRSLFLQDAPIGGPYNWNGIGTRVGHIGVSISVEQGTAAQDLPVYKKLEELADDGDATTGWIHTSGRHLFFQFDELRQN